MTKEQQIKDYQSKIDTYRINIRVSKCETNKRVLRQLILGYEKKIKDLKA